MDWDYLSDCTDSDVDGDGWAWWDEIDCSTSDNNTENKPSDNDGDLTCDAVDDDDDNDGWLDVDEVLCNTSTRDYFERPDDLDRDGTCDSLDNDIDGDEVINAEDEFPRDPTLWSLEAEQSEDEGNSGSDGGIGPSNQDSEANGCWFECWFDKTFKLGGERLSDATRPGGGDPTTMALSWPPAHLCPDRCPSWPPRRLLKIYDGNDKASRKLMRRVGRDWQNYDPITGGIKIIGFETPSFGMLTFLLGFVLLVSRELLLVYLIGFIMYFSFASALFFHP